MWIYRYRYISMYTYISIYALDEPVPCPSTMVTSNGFTPARLYALRIHSSCPSTAGFFDREGKSRHTNI